MQNIPDIKIFRAQHSDVDAMAHIFVNSFDRDGSVRLMYTKDEIRPVIQGILHDYLDNDQVEFRLAVTRDTEVKVGWISFGIIPATGLGPEFAFNEMTSWATQKLFGGNETDRRCRLAVQLRDRSREGQTRHMPSHRLVINTIVVNPEYRRLGVAGKLLSSIVDLAKSVDWGIWAQTPNAYVGLFWQNLFHEVDVLALDLNDFKPPEEVAMGIHGIQLGVQTWRQMKLGTRAELVQEREKAKMAVAGNTQAQMSGPNAHHAGS